MKIGNTEVKFNFKELFRANTLLSTQPDAKDGASQLWLQFLTGDENEAVYNALRRLNDNHCKIWYTRNNGSRYGY